MSKKELIILLLLSILYSVHALAGNNVRTARTFSIEELGNSTYTAFCMDSCGFMWIGTDNGLIRFDGNHYNVYRHQEGNTESVSDNRILGLIRDNDDNIWVATANGLNLYDAANDSFRRISIPDFGENGYIISITCALHGSVTFIVGGVGIYSIEIDKSGSMTITNIASPKGQKDVNCILAHKNGKLYAGTNKGIVYESTDQKVWMKAAEVKSAVFDISQEQNGTLLINSFDGVYRHNPSSRETTHIQLDTDAIVNNLSEPVGDWVYLATYGSGLWKLHMDSEVAEYCNDIYSPFIDMANSRIGSVYGADDGSLWIGVDFYGIIMLSQNGTSFVYRKLSNIIKDFDLPLRAIDVWKGNSVIGNSKGEVAIISKDGNVINNLKLPERGIITSIDVIEGDKAILGVVESGVWELDLLNGSFHKMVDIPEKYISIEVCATNDGSVYIGLFAKGLLKFNPKTGEKTWISNVSDGKGLHSPYITTIKAYDDKLWIGSYGGVGCFDLSNGRFEDIDQTPYMACATFDIVQESPTSVLLGTSNGLIRYNLKTKEMKKYTSLDGLSDNDVRSIAIDGSGRIWIGTMLGINYEYPEGGGFVAYAGGNGMVERTFESMYYSPETELVYAAGKMGLTCFTPAAVTLPVFSSALKITDVYKKGKKMNPIEYSGFPDVINLSHNENSIAFRISTMDFRDTSNLKYLWRFADDKEWVELPDGTDIINLSSLAPGRYTLEFKAKESGVESQISVIRINVSYPWYLTWYAKTVYVLIFVAVLCLCLAVARKRQKERINEKKMEFFMDMSHDMRSPLTLIIGPLESLLKEKLKRDVRQRIRGVYRNAHRILNIVNQLLDIKKIDYGRKRLECRKTKLPEFIGEIVEMFLPQAEDKGITLTFSSYGLMEEAWIDRSVIDRIMVNLISNAIKFTPENGNVEIILSEACDSRYGKCVEIVVMDSGIGLDNGETTDIFRRSYRSVLGASFEEDGYGLGLDICRRYIQLHHGDIRAENRDDGARGSRFMILIPLEKERYNPGELISDDIDSDLKDNGTLIIGTEPEEDGSGYRNDMYSECRLLIVEDDDHLREALYDFFKDKYHVLTASDGEEGYEIVRELIPDVIVSDVKMPRSDGIQLLQRLKSNSETDHIPFALLSSKNAVADRVTGLKHGAEAYITKPFDFNELNAIVHNLIDVRKKFGGKLTQEAEAKSTGVIPHLKGNDEILIERVDKVLDTRINEEDMNVDRLAQAVGVSRTHLYRKFKERIGINPSDYIRNRRLQKACELLKNDDLDITQIAYALGFSSQSQFSTTFKRFLSCTPTEYRIKHKKKSDS